jgi:hypothetical protein
MKILKSYRDFQILLESHNFEKQRITVGEKIVNFLKKHKFVYEGSRSDSDIFISFKTGDFETIIPKKTLGGTLYSSPQGFYSFDMNGFKQRLFGDDEISAENFNPKNLSRSSNVIEQLGLGYANHGNEVSPENIWSRWYSIPRYLHFVKVKDGSLILTSNSNSLKFYDPLEKLLNFYLHNFLKENESNIFDPNDKRDSGLSKKNWKELYSYFNENKSKYKSRFIDGLLSLFKSIEKDESELHSKMYYFILNGCCQSINDNVIYMMFTDICRAIGIDGFTQRKNNKFIHSLPEFQTLLLTDSCVEELMKIDLTTELRIDRDIFAEKSEKNLENFLSTLKKGDVLWNKKEQYFKRFENRDSLLKDNVGEKTPINTDDFVKVDLSNNKLWNFIKNLKSGDWIKITSLYLDTHRDKVLNCIIMQFNDVSFSDNRLKFEERGRVFLETVIYSSHINYTIDGKQINKQYKYNIDTKDRETPLFDPQRVSPPEYKYFMDNKSEFRGLTIDEIISEFDNRKVIHNLEELFTSEQYAGQDNRVRIRDDMDLLRLLTNFTKEYAERVLNFRSDSYTKNDMTLYHYRGNLNQPIRVIYSNNPQF